MQTPAEREVSCPVPTRKTPNQLQTSSRCSLYYSILLDQVQLALIVRDLEDRICFWNKGAEHLYGWRADEVTGENVYDLLFPLDVNDQPFKEETELQNLSVGGLYLRLKRMVREGAEVFSPCGCPRPRAGTVLYFVPAPAGRVLRVEPQWDGSYGVAVEFLRPPHLLM